MAATQDPYTRPSPSGEPLARLLEQLPLEDRPAVDAALAIGGDFLVAATVLRSGGRDADAATLIGQALSRRAAVWWACRAARGEPGPGDPRTGAKAAVLKKPELDALEAAEAWVRAPGQALARAAEVAAKRARGTPGGCAALAAFFSGESLSPPDLPANVPTVTPPEHLCGLAAVGAVRIAAVRTRPDLAAQTLARAIDDGIALAAGKGAWEVSAGPSAPPRR